MRVAATLPEFSEWTLPWGYLEYSGGGYLEYCGGEIFCYLNTLRY